ncbi:hypothetical protein [Streptomyces sp. B1-3]|uniref:hypothetical protein n=1 Tax=Streptomyces sp. B1-3 TaxID=3141453 RepID=UPI003D27D527
MSLYHPGAPVPPPEPPRAAGRSSFTPAQVAGVVAFPVLGTGLSLNGMPLGDILTLLGGCGVIGAVTIATASGGRRLLAALAAAVRAAGTEPGAR